MKRNEVTEKIMEYGIVAVVRADSKEQAIKVVEAVKRGGIRAIEVTMTVPGALDIISELKHVNDEEELIIGAGTVLDAETARLCILHGADFIVSPYMNAELVKLCNRYRVMVMPGAATIKEAVEALEYGVDIVKIFPAGVFGPSVISSFKGPIPQGEFMPTGGVNIDNLKEWIKSGAVAVGTGGELTKGAKTGDYEAVEKAAASFVNELAKARAEVKR